MEVALGSGLQNSILPRIRLSIAQSDHRGKIEFCKPDPTQPTARAQRLAYVRPRWSTMAFFSAAGSIAPCLR